MKFVLVNGGRAEGSCTLCREPIGASLVAFCRGAVSALRIPRGQPRNCARSGLVKRMERRSHASAPKQQVASSVLGASAANYNAGQNK